MKVKELIQIFAPYTTIELNYNNGRETINIYRGDIWDIPTELHNYKLDSYKDVEIDEHYGAYTLVVYIDK